MPHTPDSYEAWQRMLKQAVALTPEECRRHALVATDNNHSCQSCFVCACAAIVDTRNVNGTFWIKAGEGHA